MGLVVDAAQMLGLVGSDDYTPEDRSSLDLLKGMFPQDNVDPNLGYGVSGADPNATRTRDRCSRDFPSTGPAFYYAPMTHFGAKADYCRTTGAVAHINAYDLRPWRLDPKWKPAASAIRWEVRIPCATLLRDIRHLRTRRTSGCLKTM